MDAFWDFSFVFSAVIFTLVAVIAAAIIIGNNKPSTSSTEPVKGETTALKPLSSPLEDFSRDKEQENTPPDVSRRDPPSVHGRDDTESQSVRLLPKTTDTLQDPSTSHLTTLGDKYEKPTQNDEPSNVYSGMCTAGKRAGDEDRSLRYTPGMLRTSQLEKMMSKEELEEEQRVQREQLAAIFKLLKENQDTFGDVTENDIEEQLKLYSI